MYSKNKMPASICLVYLFISTLIATKTEVSSETCPDKSEDFAPEQEEIDIKANLYCTYRRIVKKNFAGNAARLEAAQDFIKKHRSGIVDEGLIDEKNVNIRGQMVSYDMKNCLEDSKDSLLVFTETNLKVLQKGIDFLKKEQLKYENLLRNFRLCSNSNHTERINLVRDGYISTSDDSYFVTKLLGLFKSFSEMTPSKRPCSDISQAISSLPPSDPNEERVLANLHCAYRRLALRPEKIEDYPSFLVSREALKKYKPEVSTETIDASVVWNIRGTDVTLDLSNCALKHHQPLDEFVRDIILAFERALKTLKKDQIVLDKLDEDFRKCTKSANVKMIQNAAFYIYDKIHMTEVFLGISYSFLDIKRPSCNEIENGHNSLETKLTQVEGDLFCIYLRIAKYTIDLEDIAPRIKAAQDFVNSHKSVTSRFESIEKELDVSKCNESVQSNLANFSKEALMVFDDSLKHFKEEKTKFEKLNSEYQRCLSPKYSKTVEAFKAKIISTDKNLYFVETLRQYFLLFSAAPTERACNEIEAAILALAPEQNEIDIIANLYCAYRRLVSYPDSFDDFPTLLASRNLLEQYILKIKSRNISESINGTLRGKDVTFDMSTCAERPDQVLRASVREVIPALKASRKLLESDYVALKKLDKDFRSCGEQENTKLIWNGAVASYVRFYLVDITRDNVYSFLGEFGTIDIPVLVVVVTFCVAINCAVVNRIEGKSNREPLSRLYLTIRQGSYL